MYIQTMPALTYRHRIVDYRASSLLKSPMILPTVRSSTPVLAFLREITDKQAHILKTLENARLPMSRNQLAKVCHRGRQTIQRDLDMLVQRGKLCVQEKQQRGRMVRLYTLHDPTQIIRRDDGQFARYCTCGQYVRFRRHKGVYVFNCRSCGRRYFEDSINGGGM